MHFKAISKTKQTLKKLNIKTNIHMYVRMFENSLELSCLRLKNLF